jgi:hypothetical protein
MKIPFAVPVIAALIALALPQGVAAGTLPKGSLLPDLRMTVYGMTLEESQRGVTKLRFGTLLANVGDGPIEVRGHGREGRQMLNPEQWITRANGQSYGVPLPNVTLLYNGDGHDHFHIQGLNVARLIPVEVADPAAAAERHWRKIGFCLMDVLKVGRKDRPAWASKAGDYYSCGNRHSGRIRMGISVGYQDDYRPSIAWQSVVVDELPPGRYLLCVTANATGVLIEKPDSATNNSHWLRLDINVAKNKLALIEEAHSPC